MPVEFGIWKIDGKHSERIQFSSMEREAELEDVLEHDLGILDPGLMLIGRQVSTEFGKYIDLLAVDGQGDLLVIELKRDKTPRDVVAQVLDYGSWVQSLTYEGVVDIYRKYHEGRPFEEAFDETFGQSPPEKLNESHELVIVASGLDSSTERIISYLSSQYGVPINAVFFRHFRENGSRYLARTWLIDPSVAEAQASRSSSKKKKEPWNGQDFYVSLGEGTHRTWEDCRKYGFVSGGQGKWYSRTLHQLFPGARIFVHLPGEGYVGVGRVKGEAVRVRDFSVWQKGQEVPILDAPLKAPAMDENADDEELSEYLVRVDWNETRSKKQAIWETGMFANQNTVCKLRNKFTLDRLAEHFELEE